MSVHRSRAQRAGQRFASCLRADLHVRLVLLLGLSGLPVWSSARFHALFDPLLQFGHPKSYAVASASRPGRPIALLALWTTVEVDTEADFHVTVLDCSLGTGDITLCPVPGQNVSIFKEDLPLWCPLFSAGCVACSLRPGRSGPSPPQSAQRGWVASSAHLQCCPVCPDCSRGAIAFVVRVLVYVQWWSFFCQDPSAPPKSIPSCRQPI